MEFGEAATVDELLLQQSMSNGARDDIIPDTSDPEDFITELSALDRVFQVESVASIQVGDRQRKFRIRSVPKHELEQGMLEMRPRKLPKIKDPRTGQLVVDEDSGTYRQWLLTYGYIKVLLGLASLTLRDRNGQIVWQVPGTIRELPLAIEAFKTTGITSGQVENLSKAIDDLTALHQENDQEELLGNSSAG